jgi:hypothetical protein
MSRNRFNFFSIISHKKLYLTNNYPASIGSYFADNTWQDLFEKNAQTDLHLRV